MALFSWFNIKNQSSLPQTRSLKNTSQNNVKKNNNWPTAHISPDTNIETKKLLPFTHFNTTR